MLLTISKSLWSWSRKRVSTLKRKNRGDWHWMQTKTVPLASLNRSLWRSAESSSNYYLLLFLSGAIATFGLLANSSATVIGAMIVAPLMGPIEGIAFAMVMANRRLFKRACLSLVLGSLLTIGTAAILSGVIGIDSLTEEISARTRPTLLDLGVALAAGGAGALAKSRRGVADALPGVAIAVALVPPLSVIGIGIAFASQQIFLGASLLFLTNLIGIIFSGAIVFLSHRYGSIERAKRGLVFSITALVCLGIPLSLSFQDLVLKKQTSISVNNILRRRSLTFAEADIQSISVKRQGPAVAVKMDVEAVEGSISNNQVSLVRDLLAQELDHPVSLDVRVIPVERFTSVAPEADDRSSLQSDSSARLSQRQRN